MCLVSVIIPTHNRAHMVMEAVASVFAQTHPGWELLVVDDGSSDDTVRILSPHQGDLRVISIPRSGVSAARNRGVRESRGEWVAFLDSDDLWLPEKLARQLRALKRFPDAPLCYTDEIWIRNDRRVNPRRRHKKHTGWIFEHCLPLCIISPSSAMLRREVFDEVGGFDESLPACEDYDLWLRITARYPVLFLDQKLIVKRGGHPDQLSRETWGLDRLRIRALLKILKDPHLSGRQRTAAGETLARKCRIYAQGARRRGRIAEADLYERLAARAGEDENDGANDSGSHGGHSLG